MKCVIKWILASSNKREWRQTQAQAQALQVCVTLFYIIPLKPDWSVTLYKTTKMLDSSLTLSQTGPDFYVSAVQVFWKLFGKRRNCLWLAISPFSTVFSTLSVNFPPFSSTLKLSSENSFSLGRVQNLLFGKGLTKGLKMRLRLLD